MALTPMKLFTPEGLVHYCHPIRLAVIHRNAHPIGAGTSLSPHMVAVILQGLGR